MKNLRDWAKYYYNKGIVIWLPEYYSSISWQALKKHKQTLSEIDNYSWFKSNHVSGVAGKKGIIAISLSIKGKDFLYKKNFVNKVLSLLNLNNYPWIFNNKNEITVIINCPVEKKVTEERYDNFSILYEGIFQMPSNIVNEKFFYNGIPVIKPAYIKESLLENCIKVLKDSTYFINKCINHLEE